MSGKRVTKIPRKFADCQDLEVQMAGRTAPYVKVKFVDDGQLEMYDSALISNEIIHPDTDESIRFEDLYVGQEVAALWRKTKHYVATVVELFQGEKSKDKKTVKPAPKTSKAKVTVKTVKKTLIKDSEGTAESSEEACLIDVEVKKKKKESTLEPSTSQQKKRKYQPKTRPDIQMADYIDIGPNGTVPENFQVLAPGAPIAVKTLWLHNLLSTLSKHRAKKDKKAEKKGTVVREERGVEVLKRLMDGFFDPCDLAVEGGTKRFIDNPVFKSLQLYATHYLNMSVPSFKKHWNAKMVSSRQTLKRFKKQEEEA